MPPRLSKRQQRAIEELEALGGSPKDSEPEASEDEVPAGKSVGVFATGTLLDSTESEGDGTHTDEGQVTKKSKKGKKKKKKKKPVARADDIAISDQGLTTTPQAQVMAKPDPQAEPKETLTVSERKALKKAKQKERKAKDDDIDKVLAELSIKPSSQQIFLQTTSKDRSVANLLGVSLQHLDAEAELRKFFGSRVVQAMKTGSSSHRRNVGALRSNLTRPQPSWWAANQREGLSIRPLTEDEFQDKLKRHRWEAIDERWWTVEYSKKYKSMTRSFTQTVMSGDPQGFWDLLRRLPWHADTLLQVSEVYRHREEHAQAVDFVDRALFTYERSFIGAFNFTSGLNRLDFDRVENRPFFLAIHRQVVDLQRRGCVRTGFEFARLLYSLDPWTDPHGALLHLDHVAVKAGMTQWLLDVYETFDNQHESSNNLRLNPSFLPSWAYSRALALRMQEQDGDDTTGTRALTEAIKDYPYIVPLLADKLEVNLPASVRSHPDCKIETDASSLSYSTGLLHLLSHLYAQRSSQLWKDHAEWFADTVTQTFASLPSPPNSTPPRRKALLTLYDNSESLRYSVYRHVVVLESSYRRLFSFIPRYVFEGKSLACDPLPPKDAVTEYDAAFFEGTEDIFAAGTRTRRDRALDQRRLAQMVPDAGFRQQLEGFFEAQGLADRFPGGIVQFAQFVAQLAPEELEDILLNGLLAMGEGGPGFGAAFDAGLFGAGGMPGQMPGEDMLGGDPGGEEGDPVAGAVEPDQRDEPGIGDEEEDEDEDEDEDEYVSPMPRMIRNILGRLWGRPAPAEESSSEDEDARDLNAVD